MIPGSNILATALSVIGRASFLYYEFYRRTTNEIALNVNEYAAPVTLTGSFQPVPRNLYAVYGLNFQKDYATIFVEQNVIDITRDVGGDKFVYNCKTWQAISKTDWFAVDGWVSILCVRISDAR